MYLVINYMQILCILYKECKNLWRIWYPQGPWNQYSKDNEGLLYLLFLFALVQHILKFPLRYSLWHISCPAQQHFLVIWIGRLVLVCFLGLYLQMFLAIDFFIFKLEYMRQRENPDFHHYFTYFLGPKSPTQSYLFFSPFRIFCLLYM